MFQRLGFINANEIREWLVGVEKLLEFEKWNGKVNSSGRKCCWFGKEVELGFNSKVKNGLKLDRFLVGLGDENFGMNWNSVLVYKYGVGCELKDHVDRDVFFDEVGIINVCKGMVGFKYDGKVFWLKDGEVLWINSKKLHGVLKCGEVRYSLQFRNVK